MAKITSDNKEEIKKICLALKQAINEFSKSKLFNKQTRLLSIYAEVVVIDKLLDLGIKTILRKSNPKVDFELPEIGKKIEVKGSFLKEGAVFGNHYDATQKGEFDCLILVGINELNGELKERFFIFSKEEADNFDKGAYVGKPGYFVTIYTKGLPPRKKLSDFMLKVNQNLSSYEGRWDKIK